LHAACEHDTFNVLTFSLNSSTKFFFHTAACTDVRRLLSLSLTIPNTALKLGKVDLHLNRLDGVPPEAGETSKENSVVSNIKSKG
jgi:hypothetical protein